MKLLLPSLFGTVAALASVAEGIQISGGGTAPGAPAPAQFGSFCDRYRVACLQVVLEGTPATGTRNVVYKCNKKKNNVDYSFGCKSGKGTDFTNKALNRATKNASVSTVTSVFSTTTMQTTSTVTATSTTPTTVTESTTTTVDEQTTPTVSTTLTVQTVVQSLTTTYTTEYTSTQTIVTIGTTVTEVPVPYTTTVTASATSTQYGPAAVQVQTFVINLADRNPRRAVRLDNSSFCTAYSNACGRQCARVGSSPRHQICSAKGGNRWTLGCICKNKQVETQHALNDAGNDVSISVVSSLATATSTVYETQTTLVPSTTTVTGTSTATNTITLPTTLTSTATSTSTLTVPITSTVSTLTATTTTAPTTSYVPTLVATSTTTSTTVVVLATGVIKVQAAADASPIGFVGVSVGNYPQEQDPTLTEALATTFLLVRDPATQLTQFQALDGSNAGLAYCAGSYDSGPAHKWMLWCTPDAAPGPSQGSSTVYGMQYETWFTKVQSNGEIVPAWYQPDGSIASAQWDFPIPLGNPNYYYMETPLTTGYQPLQLFLVSRTAGVTPTPQ